MSEKLYMRKCSKVMFIGITHAWGPFYEYGLTLILAWISNHMPGKVWDGITYSFPSFNSATAWISNFIPHIKMDVITYPCWG